MPFIPASHHHPFVCERCNTRQWVYVGDPDDLTLPDVDVVRCYACGHAENVAGDALGHFINVVTGDPHV